MFKDKKNIAIFVLSLILCITFGAVGHSLYLDSKKNSNDKIPIFDIISECDLLSAHPDDPERLSEGVDDDALVPKLALLSCERELEERPEDPRIMFQLGRAYLSLGKKEEAIDLFSQASDLGYAAAKAHMGDVFQFGVSDRKVDIEKAKKFYQEAADGDFLVAKEQIEQLTFDQMQFSSDTVLKAFFDNDLDAVNKKSNSDRKKIIRNYVFNFVTQATNHCEHFLKPAALARLYLYQYPQRKVNSYEEKIDIHVAIQTSLGEIDAKRFVNMYGCDGYVSTRMFKNIEQYFEKYKPSK